MKLARHSHSSDPGEPVSRASKLVIVAENDGDAEILAILARAFTERAEITVDFTAGGGRVYGLTPPGVLASRN